MRSTVNISVTISKDLLTKLDKERGMIPRSRILAMLVEGYVGKATKED